MLYSLILPGLLSTGVKWYILKDHTGKGSNVLSSMVYNQVSLLVVSTLLGLTALMLTNPGGHPQLPITCAAVMAAIICGCVLVLNKRAAIKVAAAVRYALNPFPRKIQAGADTILGQIRTFHSAGWGFHLAMAGISLVSNIVTVAIYVFASRAAEITVPSAVLIWQSCAVYVLGRLPISVANLGVREYTLTEFLGLYGVEAPRALLMSMIIFSCALFVAAIGAVCQLFWGLRANKSD
jgi:hypothetical protein